MEMQKIECDPHDWTNLERFASENHVWELRCQKVAFGLRWVVGRCPEGVDYPAEGYVEEYCAGANDVAVLLVKGVMLKLMAQLPEDTSDNRMRDFLPKYGRRPIRNDKQTWTRLCLLAGMTQQGADGMWEVLQAADPGDYFAEDHP